MSRFWRDEVEEPSFSLSALRSFWSFSCRKVDMVGGRASSPLASRDSWGVARELERGDAAVAVEWNR